MADNILSDFGINILEEEIDDVIFQTNEFLTDATFTGSQGPFWWILQMCMALAALFSIIVAASMAYKMMVKNEPLDVMKLFKPLVVSIILCWWYPPADTGMTNSGSSWCVLDFLSYIPNCIGSYTHDLYEAEATQISDKFEEVQQLVYVRDSMYTDLQAQADVAHKGTSDPNLIEATMEQTGVDEVTNMEKDASKLWFTSLTAGAVVGIDKIVMLIALIVFRIGWWATIYCQQILLGMLTIFGPIQWAFSLLPKWEGAWAKWLTRYLTVHFYGAMLYFVGFYVLLLFDIVLCIQVENLTAITASEQTMAAYLQNSFFSMEQTGVDEVTNMEKDASKLWFTSLTAGAVVGIDKIVMLIALIVFRIGWWATIYCQQILLGMLTIFGPIQWAFSLLPKWEGAWAKWLTRYLTVHFYGAMLYFVGFYVLLLFDIVLCIQVENLTAITASEQTMAAYLQNSFFSAGYLMAASIVALKCLNLVPDLAAWMIPEGDTAFSTRNFGEGVAQQAKMTATGTMATVMR